jgi:LPXTG-site transpeptidase (sortase) family protein
MTTREKTKFIVLRSIGNFLLLFSLYGVTATFGPAIAQEARFRIEQAKGIKYKVVADSHQMSRPSGPSPTPPPSGGFAALLSSQKERILVPADTQFSILIPKIGASAKVTPNVDPGNEQEFRSVLQHSIAHAKGTVFPGMPGNTYLFAHSTDNWWDVGRYNAVFYLLKDLKKDDDVIVYFENKRYNYVVTDSFIVEPTDVSLLVHSRGTEQQLILQTCWPPGTTWKRLFITARSRAV